MQSGSGSGRGRHRNRRSAETREFEQLARRPDSVLNLPPEPKNQHGIRILPGAAGDSKDSEPHVEAKPKRLGPPPECPGWMRPEEYELLMAMRKGLA